MALIKSWLADFKQLTRASTLLEVETLCKSLKTDINALDLAVSTLKPSKSKFGFINLSNVSLGSVNKLLREGDLAEIVKISGKNIPFTKIDEELFQKLISDTPERVYKNVNDYASSAKREFPHLNINESELESISKTGAQDVKKVESNLFKYFKQGATVTLTIGVVVVGVDWLVKATEQRKGCFMLTTINNKVASCKVQSYSCIGEGGTFCPSISKNYYNVTLILVALASIDPNVSNALRKMIADKCNITESEFSLKLSSLIDQYYSEITAIVAENYTLAPPFEICSVSHPDVENGKIPECRMCSPSSNPISTTYIDPSLYPDNVTFQCSISPTLLDTISDVVITTGANILQGVSSGLKTILKPILIGILIVFGFIVIIAIIYITFKKLSQRKMEDEQTLTIHQI